MKKKKLKDFIKISDNKFLHKETKKVPLDLSLMANDTKEYVNKFENFLKEREELDKNDNDYIKKLMDLTHKYNALRVSVWDGEPGYLYMKNVEETNKELINKDTELYNEIKEVKEHKKKFKTEKKRKIDVLNINEKLTVRNIHLENKIGEIKNTVKDFVNFYKENKDIGKVEVVFELFKKKYTCLTNHNWTKYKPIFYKYKGKLK